MFVAQKALTLALSCSTFSTFSERFGAVLVVLGQLTDARVPQDYVRSLLSVLCEHLVDVQSSEVALVCLLG